MAKIRAMFVGHGPSNLPEDRVVNVFHFDNATDYPAHADLVSGALDTIYTLGPEAITDLTNPIGAYLSPWVQRGAEIRTYDLSAPEPRVPTVTPIVLPAPITGSGLPEEVAVCLSFSSFNPPFSARRRGRVYIGPLCSAAMFSAESTHSAVPTSTLITDLGLIGAWLSNVVGLDWAIRSTRPTENFVQVGRGWVDNAFDTQRRRGPDATTRNPWAGAGL